MTKPLLTIQELQPGKLYERIDNPFPNHILHYVDDAGNYWNKDLIVKTQHKNFVGYNDALKLRFFEVDTKEQI